MCFVVIPSHVRALATRAADVGYLLQDVVIPSHVRALATDIKSVEIITLEVVIPSHVRALATVAIDEFRQTMKLSYPLM